MGSEKLGRFSCAKHSEKSVDDGAATPLLETIFISYLFEIDIHIPLSSKNDRVTTNQNSDQW